MDEWKTVTWGDVITLQRGFDITRATQNLSGDVPVISSGGAGSFHDVASVNRPGVIIGRKGTLGRVYWAPGPHWPHDTTLWVKDFKGNDPRFVFYALHCLDVSWLDVGSANPTLNRNHVHPLAVRWPKTPREQQRIASVLGALDGLIEHDCAHQAALLDLALAVYRTCGSERRPLSDFYEVALGGVWGDDLPSEPTVPTTVLRGRDLEDILEFKPAAPPQRHVSVGQAVKRRLGTGDLLTAGSGTLGPSLPVVPGFAALFGEPAAQVLYSNFVKRFVPTGDSHNRYGLAWLSLMDAWQSGVFDTFKTGTAMPNLDAKALLSGVTVPVANDGQNNQINDLVAAALDSRFAQERAELIRTRDELLPLLTSGKVRVRDVEGLVT